MSSLKIIGLSHFLKFLGPSAKNYNLQSLMITLYHSHHEGDQCLSSSSRGWSAGADVIRGSSPIIRTPWAKATGSSRFIESRPHNPPHHHHHHHHHRHHHHHNPQNPPHPPPNIIIVQLFDELDVVSWHHRPALELSFLQSWFLSF